MKRAQTALEYVYLIGLVAAALIAVLVFLSRGMQGNLRVQADQMGEQYSPKNMSTDITQVSQVSLSDVYIVSSKKSTNSTSTTMTNKGKEEVVKTLKQESF